MTLEWNWSTKFWYDIVWYEFYGIKRLARELLGSLYAVDAIVQSLSYIQP